MATANRRTAKASGARRSGWLTLLALALAVMAAIGWYYREPIRGYTLTGASFGARTACACRFIAGRELSDCQKDFEPGMEIVFLSEDAETQSVTARVPLLSSQTATFREGYGCVLERWED
ncbi:hypothetical protein [Altericroceibacterium xinjiangense]|uniref:hypothetical protein n=1 Tax=Altericroceibacterium xinjiangense TaxID=762261 RepID=UPI0019CFDEDE|nr:hypothetical protein [Altericroceibacterium xinjiangense]